MKYYSLRNSDQIMCQLLINLLIYKCLAAGPYNQNIDKRLARKLVWLYGRINQMADTPPKAGQDRCWKTHAVLLMPWLQAKTCMHATLWFNSIDSYVKANLAIYGHVLVFLDNV